MVFALENILYNFLPFESNYFLFRFQCTKYASLWCVLFIVSLSVHWHSLNHLKYSVSLAAAVPNTNHIFLYIKTQWNNNICALILDKITMFSQCFSLQYRWELHRDFIDRASWAVHGCAHLQIQNGIIIIIKYSVDRNKKHIVIMKYHHKLFFFGRLCQRRGSIPKWFSFRIATYPYTEHTVYTFHLCTSPQSVYTPSYTRRTLLCKSSNGFAVRANQPISSLIAAETSQTDDDNQNNNNNVDDDEGNGSSSRGTSHVQSVYLMPPHSSIAAVKQIDITIRFSMDPILNRSRHS